MQEFIKNIQEEIPNLSEYRIKRLLDFIKYRYRYYGKFGLGKREGHKVGISERQMNYFIKLMVNYGFLEIVDVTRGKNRPYMLNIYRLSDYLKKKILELKDYVKTSSLSEKIKNWNIGQNIINYLGDIVTLKTKYKVTKFELNGIKYVLYKGGILNTDTNKKLGLFDFLMEYYGETKAYNLAIKLNIIG